MPPACDTDVAIRSSQQLCLLALDPHKSGPPTGMRWVCVGPHRSWERKRNNITVVYPLVSLLDSTGDVSKSMITQMVSVKSVGHQTKVMNVGEIFIKTKRAHMDGRNPSGREGKTKNCQRIKFIN